MRAGTQGGQSGDRIGYEFGAMLPFLTRRQDDPTIFNVGLEGITRLEIESPPQRAGKNDLAFGGELGLHGKTILPCTEV